MGGIINNHVAEVPEVNPERSLPGADPGWLPNYSMVAYGESPASKRAIEHRLERAAFRAQLGLSQDPWEFSEANVAVITYEDPETKKLVMLPMISSGGMIDGNRGEAHSEVRLLAALQARNIPMSAVKEVYTERQPCGGTHRGCSHELQQAVPGVSVVFSVEFANDAPSQARGLRALREDWEQQVIDRRDRELTADGTEGMGQRSPEDMGGGSAMVQQLREQFKSDPAAQQVIDGMLQGKTIGALRSQIPGFDAARERVDAALR